MAQHPAAEQYEKILDRVERLHNQIKGINVEFEEIQSELELLNKMHRLYVKEVIKAFNKEGEVEPTIKRYKKVVKKLGIKTPDEDLTFLQEEVLGYLSYYDSDCKAEDYEDE